ncbi:MAG: rhodanese-like domain-containing protein [Mariprofundales bacterium]|nr:rhodanese-like domain-containing protein [Mariprofundales bacterium]
MAKRLKDFIAEAKAVVKEISAEDVEAKLASNPLLLDVREAGELVDGTLPTALHIPRGVLELKADLDFPMRETRLTDRDQEVILYCASGGRSLLAAATLQEMGFSNVKSMAGGFCGWQEEGRRVVAGR